MAWYEGSTADSAPPPLKVSREYHGATSVWAAPVWTQNRSERGCADYQLPET